MASETSALAGVLTTLAARLRLALDVKTADVWDGPWRALADAGRLSIAMPAALVSLNAFTLDHLGRARWAPGQLRAVAAGDAHRFPAPGQRADPATPAPESTAPVPQLRVEIGVTLLAADAKASQRAATVAALAEASVPVMAGAALADVRGTNLYTRALYAKGLAAFMLVAHRDIELAPDPPGRVPPERVDLVHGAGVRETLWPVPEEAC